MSHLWINYACILTALSFLDTSIDIHAFCIENINFLLIIFIANTVPQKKKSLYVGSHGFYNNCSSLWVGVSVYRNFKSFWPSLAVHVKIKNLWLKIRALYLPYGMRNDFIQMRYLKKEFSKNEYLTYFLYTKNRQWVWQSTCLWWPLWRGSGYGWDQEGSPEVIYCMKRKHKNKRNTKVWGLKCWNVFW